MEKTKYLIQELSNIQDLYFSTLVDEVGVFEEEEDWVFDYVFNKNDDYKTFEDFLARYGKTIDEIIHE